MFWIVGNVIPVIAVPLITIGGAFFGSSAFLVIGKVIDSKEKGLFLE
jgi:hypothetical protein